MSDGLPDHCDVLIVGAGPAGATAAIACAERGLDVVLAERSAFPRPKVCGCCLNARSLSVLARVGVLPSLEAASGTPLQRLAVHAGGRRAAIALPRGLAVSRDRLDFELATAAATRGASFHDRCRVRSLAPHENGEHWRAELDDRGRHKRLTTSVVLVAEGLAGRLLEGTALGGVRTRRDAKIGVGTWVEVENHHAAPGVITMASGAGGYIGAVVLEDGRLDVAAAIDPDASREAGGPGPLIASLLRRNGVDLGFDPAARVWRGTPRLTRQRLRLADGGVFVLGDAAGYVEPFTGEGMAWAMSAGLAVAPLAEQAVERWHPELSERWTATMRRLVRRRQRWCRAISFVLRHPPLAGAMVGAMKVTPGLSRPVVTSINEPVTPGPRGERVEQCV